MSRTEAVSSLTRKNKVGLGLAAFLGLADTSNFFMIPQGDSDTPGPPVAVLIADGVLGVITVAAVVYAWRLTSRTASRVVAGARILSVITALPALFVVVIGLVLSRPAPEPVAA
ncbi:hypothetical protein ACFV5G_29645 [Streptomyces sp. NPDC059766]|uniref:hypothetical protein n=1 Tax=Streptomyces sp. NPDC059766 TaxID=3346940 RepID=UPI003660C2B4